MASVGVLSALEEEFRRTQENLKHVDETIMKITGRAPGEARPSLQRPTAASSINRKLRHASLSPPPSDARNTLGSRIIVPGGGGKHASARLGPPTAFSRLGPQLRPSDVSMFQDGGERGSAAGGALHQFDSPPPARRGVKRPLPQQQPPTVASSLHHHRATPKTRNQLFGPDEDYVMPKKNVGSVIARVGPAEPTRQELVERLKTDVKSQARSKRMFGMILGTLHKFKSEETVVRRVQTEKKAVVEEKIEEQKEREKEESIRQRKELFKTRRDNRLHLRKLEQKMTVARMHQQWEQRQRYLLNFIHTRARPPIMWLPKRHNDTTEKKLRESQKRIQSLIDSQKAKIKQELDAIDEQYRIEEGNNENAAGGDHCSDGEQNSGRNGGLSSVITNPNSSSDKNGGGGGDNPNMEDGDAGNSNDYDGDVTMRSIDVSIEETNQLSRFRHDSDAEHDATSRDASRDGVAAE